MGKIELTFRPYVGVKPYGNQKPYRIAKPKLIEEIVKRLVEDNGGIKQKPEKVPVYDENDNIAYYLPEAKMVDYLDYSVIAGKIFVDWVNGKVTADDDLKLNGLPLADVYSIKKTPRVKRIAKVQGEEKSEVVYLSTGKERWYYEAIGGDDENRVSHMDKYSYKCAVCDKIYGYQYKAKNCSFGHIASGKIEGDLFSAGVAGVAKVKEPVAIEVVA